MAGFSVKKGQGKQGRTSTRAYPTQVCMTQWRDPETGRLAKSPEQARAAQANGTRAKARKARGIEDRAIVTRVRQEDGEVTAARVVMQGARAAQRRGKLKKAEVRGLEKDLSRDALEAFNPARAGELHAERMHEAHRSDKAKRGAATRKKKAAAGLGKKKRPAAEVQTQLLRAEELVKDAQRRHASATTAQAKQRHGDSLRTRRARVNKLRAELAAAQ